MSRTRDQHYFGDFHQIVHEFFIFHDFCMVTTLLVGERLEVAQLRVNARWNSNICDVVNPGSLLFRSFLPRNSHIPQFLALLMLFHLGTHREWNCHMGGLTDAHIFHLFSVPTSLKVFFHRYDFIMTSAEGLGLGIIFWWNSNICNRWILGPPIFWKIIPKHARSALGCDRLQNFDHVSPLHEYWKKLGVKAIYIRHFLELSPVIRSPNFF